MIGAQLSACIVEGSSASSGDANMSAEAKNNASMLCNHSDIGGTVITDDWLARLYGSPPCSVVDAGSGTYSNSMVPGQERTDAAALVADSTMRKGHA